MRSATPQSTASLAAPVSILAIPAILAILGCGAVLAGCGGPAGPDSVDPDPTVAHGWEVATLLDIGYGQRTSAVLVDTHGRRTHFIEDEVLFEGTRAQADAFAARHGGKVVADTMPAALSLIHI